MNIKDEFVIESPKTVKKICKLLGTMIYVGDEKYIQEYIANIAALYTK